MAGSYVGDGRVGVDWVMGQGHFVKVYITSFSSRPLLFTSSVLSPVPTDLATASRQCDSLYNTIPGSPEPKSSERGDVRSRISGRAGNA